MMADDDVMDDQDFLNALDELKRDPDSDVAELIHLMNENRIISWEEAERILSDTGDKVIKSSLPEQTRPTEPDNDTNIDRCIQQLNDNDPKLKHINLNNMKRTPIPQIKRLVEAVAYNTELESLSLANLGLYENDLAPLPAMLEINTTLKKLNLETNYLSGDFFARVFQAACVNQTIEEIKAVNQGVSFATTAEKEIIDSICENRGILKVSINLRLPEGRFKIENATLRNGEIKRILRREAAARAKAEAEAATKGGVQPEEPKKETPKDTPKPAPKETPKPAAPKEAPKEKPKPKPAPAQAPPRFLPETQPPTKNGFRKQESIDETPPSRKVSQGLPEREASPTLEKPPPDEEVLMSTPKKPLRPWERPKVEEKKLATVEEKPKPKKVWERPKPEEPPKASEEEKPKPTRKWERPKEPEAPPKEVEKPKTTRKWEQPKAEEKPKEEEKPKPVRKWEQPQAPPPAKEEPQGSSLKPPAEAKVDEVSDEERPRSRSRTPRPWDKEFDVPKAPVKPLPKPIEVKKVLRPWEKAPMSPLKKELEKPKDEPKIVIPKKKVVVTVKPALPAKPLPAGVPRNKTGDMASKWRQMVEKEKAIQREESEHQKWLAKLEEKKKMEEERRAAEKKKREEEGEDEEERVKTPPWKKEQDRNKGNWTRVKEEVKEDKEETKAPPTRLRAWERYKGEEEKAEERKEEEKPKRPLKKWEKPKDEDEDKPKVLPKAWEASRIEQEKGSGGSKENGTSEERTKETADDKDLSDKDKEKRAKTRPKPRSKPKHYIYDDEPTTASDEKKGGEDRRASIDEEDYLRTRPRRRSSLLQESVLPEATAKVDKPMAVYKLRRESKDAGPATTTEKGAPPPAPPKPSTAYSSYRAGRI